MAIKIPQEVITLLSELSCESVAEELGIKVQRHRALCFMHDDHNPSLFFYGKNREHWNCFVCNKNGNAINLVIESTGLCFVDSCLWLCNKFGIHIDNNFSSIKKIGKLHVKKRKESNEVKQFSTYVAKWIIDNNSLTETGRDFLFGKRFFNKKVIEDLNIISIDNSSILVDKLLKHFDSNKLQNSGFITNTNGQLYLRFFTPCLLFPYYDVEGNLVGMQSRYLGDNTDAPRFQFLSSQKTRLFNLPIINRIEYGDDLYISEGITDCLALLSDGKNAVAIPSATILPTNDLYELKNYRLHMYPDQDDAGERAINTLKRFFINHYTILKEESLQKGIKDYCDQYIIAHKNDIK